MITADALLSRYASTRDLRDKIRRARDGCLCQLHEGVDIVDGVPEPQIGEPCWKAARKWDREFADEYGKPVPFRFDPPISEWCATCRQRQAYTEQLRASVREHAAAKRSVLQRGRALVRRSKPPPPSLPSGRNDFNPFEFDALNADEEP